MNIPLQEISSIVQICFYITGSTIAILTYRSAKKGLLNTVNTEYQKRVMDHLDELSNILYAEFDRNSEQYWAHSNNNPGFVTIVEGIIDRYLEHLQKHGNSETFELTYELPNGLRLHELAERIKSDPFLPDDIANYVVNYLETRSEVLGETIIEEFESLREILRTQQYSSLDKLPLNTHIRISNKLYDKRMSMEHVEDEVHHIRGMIKEHLESYNPLN
ncbi:hypothetical protein [Priestia megaterium]|uniref:hypothetical protein n=1 Tax=Priestia megaterium TaxID=1404 RepID=UPI002A6B1EF9|nr:hypothetical protein [Priestia megaterium]MDY0943649.1 hypothetical protein [Priestia megaterium]